MGESEKHIRSKMSSPAKLFKQFSSSSNKMWSVTSSYNRQVSNTATDKQMIDNETLDTMYTDNWAILDKNIPVKEEIKLMVKEEVSKAKQNQTRSYFSH